MWDADIWRGRFAKYSMSELVDVIERGGVDAPLSLLADEAIGRRVDALKLRVERCCDR